MRGRKSNQASARTKAGIRLIGVTDAVLPPLCSSAMPLVITRPMRIVNSRAFGLIASIFTPAYRLREEQNIAEFMREEERTATWPEAMTLGVWRRASRRPPTIGGRQHG